MKTNSFLTAVPMPSPLLAAALTVLATLTLVRGQNTFGVTNTEDDGPGSLRDAILNANLVPGSDRIEFNIPGPGPYTIFLLSQFPVIDDPVTIDGTTQPGYAGRPIIELSGARAGPNVSGMLFQTFNSTVRGLAINSFLNGNGIELGEGGNHVIQGNLYRDRHHGNCGVKQYVVRYPDLQQRQQPNWGHHRGGTKSHRR